MRPFLLSLLAGIWFIILNILNACTQPPAEVVFKTVPVPQSKYQAYQQPISTIPIVDSSPVEPIQQTELPPLTTGPVPELNPVTITPAMPVEENPIEEKPLEQRSSADPSITEIIETGERLTLDSNTPASPIAAIAPIPVQKQTASSSTFIWPVSGKVLSSFGSKPGGLRNDGINIAAIEGTPVKTVADGEVLYMNKNMKGYGNLVLIRHANGWISTYAHNKDIGVSQGTKVKQGDTIAYVGKTGNVASPQLHFSLRKDKKPVNPQQYLATNLAQTK